MLKDQYPKFPAGCTPFLCSCRDDDNSSDTDDASDGHRITENADSYKTRWRSIRVLYLTVLINNLSFGVVISSMWPYLKMVDPNISPKFVGWTFFAFSLSQMIGAIALGIWCNYAPAAQPLIASLLLRGAGSLLYGYAMAFTDSGAYAIFISRIVIGLSAGNIAVCRAVVSQLTTMTERVKAFANFSTFQALGFAVGPAMQVISYPFGEDGFYFAPLSLRLNVYTAPGFLGLIMAIVNMVVVCVWFKETEVDIYNGQNNVNIGTNEHTHPDYIAICITIITFFITLGITVQVETLITPLSMDEFAWTRKQATLYVGIILLCGFSVAIFGCQVVNIACERYGERKMLVTGLSILVVASIMYLPWGNKYPLLQASKKIITGNVTRLIITPGCSPKYQWCMTTPKIYLPQFLIGTLFLFIGYSVSYPIAKSIYSKLSGPGKQGKFMALLSAIGSLGRALGPLLLLNAYVEIGPRWMFLIVSVVLLLNILVLLCNYERIVPFHEYLEQRKTT